MTNLLSASFYRLRKHRAVYIAAATVAARAIIISACCWQRYHSKIEGYYRLHGYGHYPLESVNFFASGLPIQELILVSLLISFLCSEDSQHTIRNKIAVGKTRRDIYLSELAVCILLAVALDLLYVAAVGIFGGWPILQPHMWGRLAGRIPALIAVDLLAWAAYASVVRLLAAAAGRKSGTILAVCVMIILEFCMYGFSSGVFTFLEHGPTHAWTTAEKFKSFFAHFIMDFWPSAQHIQLTRLDTPNLWRMPLMSLVVIAVSTGLGLAVFRRKDLR